MASNFPAAKEGLRTSPIDELNLNRVYPGDPNGTPTLMIAHYVESVLMAMADYGLDLHSGGSSLHYVPSAVSARESDPERMKEIQGLMQIFGAPYSFFFPEGHAGGTTKHGAKRQNVVMFGTEMGGSGTVTQTSRPPTALVIWPWPVRSSANMMSPGPSLRTVPSPIRSSN